jgi:hypothetical protein
MPVTKYSEELFESVCDKIATSADGLEKICQECGISARHFHRWIAENENLRQKYASAREEQADFLADQILKLADDKSGDTQAGEFGEVGNAAAIQRSRLQVEARKWIAAKLKPKKYGDKVEVDQTINVNKLPDWLTAPIENSNSNKSE